MKIEIGDKVRFLNEKGEGVVTKIINKTTVAVTIEDGFELPFLISELVVVNVKQNNDKPFRLETVASTISIVNSHNSKRNKGVYFAITPEKENDITNSNFNFWLVNQTAYSITFSFSLIKSDGFETKSISELHSSQNFLIETVVKNTLDDFSNFKIDILFHSEKLHQFQAPISELVKLKAVKFYKDNTFIKNDLLDEKAFIICICDLEKDKVENEKLISSTESTIDFSKFLFQKQSHTTIPTRSKPNNNKNELEVDLHIEELLDDYSGMNNGQIIQIQLNHLQKSINKAIANRCKRIIIIHGVGNGRLKEEVRAILSLQNMQYFDGSFAKYGYGATEAIINHY